MSKFEEVAQEEKRVRRREHLQILAGYAVLMVCMVGLYTHLYG